MIKARNYSVSYQKINELVTLARSTHRHRKYSSKYSLFWISGRLEYDYKKYLKRYVDAYREFQELVDLYERYDWEPSDEVVEDQKRKETGVFTVGKDRLNYGPAPWRLGYAVDSFIDSYCRFLEQLRFILLDIYYPTKKDPRNFMRFMNNFELSTTMKKQDFEDIWDLWNEMKHVTGIKFSGFIYDRVSNQEKLSAIDIEIQDKKRRIKQDVREFPDLYVDRLITLLKDLLLVEEGH